MHTAICAFDTREQAEQARDGLLRAGFARHDLHIEHQHASSEGDANSSWDGMEREIAQSIGSRGSLKRNPGGPTGTLLFMAGPRRYGPAGLTGYFTN